MKVIAQLARLFWSRGVLGPDDAKYLLEHGFARPSDFPGYTPPTEEAEVEIDDELFATDRDDGPHGEGYEDDADERFGPHRRRHAGRPKGEVPTIDDLVDQVRDELASRADSLAQLVTLARYFGNCDSWEEALPAIRHAGPEQVAAGLARGFKRGSFTLRGIWTALDPERFHGLVEGGERHGPAVQACRILLAGRDARQLGRYGWIFRHDEIQTLNNVILAHRGLLAALRALYDAPRLLQIAFADEGHPVPFWAMVLLYNALRSGTAETDFSNEFGPLPETENEIWRQAWSAALPMDPKALTALLVSCYSGQDERDRRPLTLCSRPLFCPTRWRTPDGAFRE